MRKTWSLALLILALLLALTLVACEGGESNETEAVTTNEVTTSASDPEGTTAPEGEVTTAPEGETTEPDTASDKPADGVPTSGTYVTFFDDGNASSYLSGTDCTWEIVEDTDMGSVLKITSVGDITRSPWVKFDYAAYMESMGIAPAPTKKAAVLVFKVKAEKCTSGSFDVMCSTVERPMARSFVSVGFDTDEEGWQTLVMPMPTESKDEWKGDTVGMIRMCHGDDILGGEVMYVQSIRMYESLDALLGATEGLEKYQLGYGSSLTVEANDPVNHVKQDAPDEDASVDLWFDHITEKTVASDVTSSGKVGYTIRLAKNEISDCQFLLAPQTDRTFRIELDTLTHESGATLDTSVYFAYYHDVGKTEKMPDALPPVQGPIAVKGNQSQSFVIKAKSTPDTTAGLYSAELRIYDNESGAYIKKATVYAYVWDFTLPEDTSMTVVSSISSSRIYKSYDKKGNKNELYKNYYDFLLENRVCGYEIPYDLLSDEADAYLDNPRVKGFRHLNKYKGDAEYLSALWEKFKDKPEWMDKLFFYYVDEPYTEERMLALGDAVESIEPYFPEYAMISPFFTNFEWESADQIEYFRDILSLWCVKVYSFTPRELSDFIGTSQSLQTAEQDALYGTFAERMEREVAEGDKLWTYFCNSPTQLYCNWLATDNGVEPVISVWQCKLNDVTGVLYWHSTYWNEGEVYENIATVAGSHYVYGDGVLVYSGAPYGLDTPVSSIRLEQIREGIEDYEYLCMLEELYGEETTDELIRLVTTCVVNYTTDDDYLANVRVMLGDMVEAGMKNKV